MTIQENIDARRQRERDQQLAEHHGELFVTAMLAGWSRAFKELTPAARNHACRLLHDRFADKLQLHCGPASSESENKRLAELRRQRGEATIKLVEGAIKQAKRIIELCGEVPERGEEFAASVADGATDMLATIKARWDVTDAQQAALDNWEEGVSRWIR